MGIAVPVMALVRAIVRGAAGARALVEEGNRTAIVGPGDQLAGSTVSDIDAHGVRLTNGVRLRLEDPR